MMVFYSTKKKNKELGKTFTDTIMYLGILLYLIVFSTRGYLANLHFQKQFSKILFKRCGCSDAGLKPGQTTVGQDIRMRTARFLQFKSQS